MRKLLNFKKISWKIAFIVGTTCVIVATFVAVFMESRIISEITRNAGLQLQHELHEAQEECDTAFNTALTEMTGFKYFTESVFDREKYIEDADRYYDYELYPVVSQFIRDIMNRNDFITSAYFALDPNLAGYPRVCEVYLENINGVIMPIEPQTYDEYMNVDSFDMEWFYGAFNSGKPYWTDIHKWVDGTVIVSHCQPVIIGGEIVGIVGADIYTTIFSDIIEQISVYDTGFAIFTDSAGNHIETGEVMKDFSDEDWRKLINESAVDEIIDMELNGVEYKVAHATFGNGFALYVLAPTGEVMAEVTVSLLRFLIILVIVMAIVLTFSYYVGKGISQPIVKVVAFAGDLSNGIVNTRMQRRYKDETGDLTDEICNVADVLETLTGEMTKMSNRHEAGDMDARIDEEQFKGVYRDVAVGINGMVASYVQHIRDICSAMTGLADGNFNTKMANFPGMKAMINAAEKGLSGNLKAVGKEISGLLDAANTGNIEKRADTAGYKGDWALVLESLNQLVKSIGDRAYWYESILDAIPLPLSVTDTDMKWVFINKSAETSLNTKRADVVGSPCSNWGASICRTEDCGIACVKRGKTRTQFEQNGRHFQVDTAVLKNAKGIETGYLEIVQDITTLENNLEALTEIMENVRLVSKQVMDGAGRVAESSTVLADSATTQARSTEELNANVALIHEKTQSNAINALHVNELSSKAQEHALDGDSQMQTMLAAMESIKTASNNISKIIKTIQDIAYQTNLLSLNASVEAARAGEHGKGFNVVAEEVRSLAERTQSAAQETDDLILDSIAKVGAGTKIAVNTAESLKTIVSEFETVSNLIHEIASASSEQTELVKNMSDAIAQIDQLTQRNTETIHETAASAQELAGQAEILRGVVNSRKG